jgi:rhodanese-related sulfurtransferase/DNA-binding MarR family transcriptional regulator
MRDRRRLKTELFEQFAVVPKALASPGRLELIDLLAQAPRTVEKLAEAAGLSVANASRHLQVLRQAGLVSTQRRGLFVTYRLAGADVAQLWMTMRELASRRVAAVGAVAREYLERPEQLEPMDAEAVLARARRGEVVVVDVRPAEEYAAGHLPKAVSIPIAELKKRLSEIPRRKQVVAYCRGPYCVYASDAVRQLREAGYRANRLDEGIREWEARGLPVHRPQGEP